MIDLTGKRAVVTGASQGIGAAAAVALARAGTKVAFDFKSATAEAERTAAQIRAAGISAAKKKAVVAPVSTVIA